jgi:peptidoglycan/xylan/chitin deacetylase (PgdA/CDA1 family)
MRSATPSRHRIFFRVIILTLFSLNWLSWNLNPVFAENKNKDARQNTKVIVLNYHNIGNYNNIYAVSVEHFTQQVEYLLNHGYANISLMEFKSWRMGNGKLPERAFMLTFDDGKLSDNVNVYPILREKNLKGIFFLKTTAINADGYLNTNQIKEMVDSGLCEFGSHSVTHRNFINMNKKDLDRELVGSRKTIRSITGQDVYAFAYPNGMWDEAAKKALEVNEYQFAFTIMPGSNGFSTDPLELRRIIIKKDTSLKEFIAWVERQESLYRNYYSIMLKKTTRDGLTAVAELCKEELQKH